ncbi:UDP-N-acetylglucosamine pyrophosphorylase Qri1p [Cryptosporidium xiaoi]|uniref:UDP-N-acetylglucosamine diphosphorylase n=1 Tax=Cryptosporidium xiaoi TaxID=659607 RepID=A0AAV9XUT2_9CRYT
MTHDGGLSKVVEGLSRHKMNELIDYIGGLCQEGKHNVGVELENDGSGEPICCCVEDGLDGLLNDLSIALEDDKFVKKCKVVLDIIAENTHNGIFAAKNEISENIEYRTPKILDWNLCYRKMSECNGILHENENYVERDCNLDINEIVNEMSKDIKVGGGKIYVSELKSIPESTRSAMHEHGLTLISQGKVAVVTLSGGDGSRLGYNGPKGTYPIGKISNDSFFKIFCYRLRSLSKLINIECKIPLYIMTSISNDKKIKDYFRENNYFGLKEENVIFFKQDSIPSISIQNKIFFLESKYKLLKSPNGNGGVFNSMLNKGIIDDMEKKGIKYVFTHCIDNPLCKICDPFFVGYTDLFNLQISTKTVLKKDCYEKLGTIVEKYNKNQNSCVPQVIEYSEISRLDNCSEFVYGSIGVHLFSLEYMKYISKGDKLDYHIAIKKIKHYDISNSSIVDPLDNNGIKLEMFIFDSFEFVTVPIHCINVERNEFSPVKSNHGDDTPQNCQNAISDLNKSFIQRYTSKNKVYNNSRSSSVYLEISPLLTYFGENLQRFSTVCNSDKKYIYINDDSEIECYDEI